MKIYQAAVGTDTDYEKYFEIGYIYIYILFSFWDIYCTTIPFRKDLWEKIVNENISG